MKWKEMLQPHLMAEEQDHDNYEQIAKAAEEEGCCHEAGVLRDIAHEEHIHRHLLEEMVHEGHEMH